MRVYVGAKGFWVCRICIASVGLKGADIDRTPFAFKALDEAEAHIKEHP